MNPIVRKAWKDLKEVVSEINEQDTSEIIFEKIKKWYKKNQKFFSPDLLDKYQLKRLIEIDNVDLYPVEKSECTPKSVKNLLCIDPSSEDSVLSLVQSKLWELVVLRTDDECQICNSLGMFPLFDLKTEKVVLQCSVCGSIQTIEGEIYNLLTSTTWRLAQNKDLKVSGLI